MDYGALELSNIVHKKLNVRKKDVVPFHQSNRFYRGKIIDLLRMKSWQEKKLIDHMMSEYYKPRLDIIEIISGLIRDGLIERRKRSVQLPQ